MKKRSNRWIIEYQRRQLFEAIRVRISDRRRDPEIVREPDGSAIPLPGGRFDLSTIDVQLIDEKEAHLFNQWLNELHPRHDTLAIYLRDKMERIIQGYEFENILPIGIMPGLFDRYEKNRFHRDTLRFIGELKEVTEG